MSWFSGYSGSGYNVQDDPSDYMSGAETGTLDLFMADVAVNANNFVFNEEWDRHAEIEKRLDTLAKETGKSRKDLPQNPYGSIPGTWGYQDQYSALKSGPVVGKGGSGMRLDAEGNSITNRDFALRSYESELKTFEKQYPSGAWGENSEGLPYHDQVVDAVTKTHEEQQAQYQTLAENATTATWLAGVTLGEVGSGFIDPINIVTAPLGGSWAGGVVKWAATELAIGTTIGGAQDALIQLDQMSRNPAMEYSLRQTLASAGFSGLAQLGLGTLFAGGGYLLSRALNVAALKQQPNLPAAVAAALAVEERDINLTSFEPYNASMLHDEHVAMFNNAEKAMNDGTGVPENAAVAAHNNISNLDAAAVHKMSEFSREDPMGFVEWVKGLQKVDERAVNAERSYGEWLEGTQNRARELEPGWVFRKKDKNGNIQEEVFIRGEPGKDQTHNEIFEANKNSIEEVSATHEDFDEGFISKTGKFYTRKEAGEYIGIDKDLDVDALAAAGVPKTEAAGGDSFGSVALRYLKNDRPERAAAWSHRNAKRAGYAINSHGDAANAFGLEQSLGERMLPVGAQGLKGDQAIKAFLAGRGIDVNKMSPSEVAAAVNHISNQLTMREQPLVKQRTYADYEAAKQSAAVAEAEALAAKRETGELKIGDPVEEPDVSPEVKQAFDNVLAEEKARIAADPTMVRTVTIPDGRGGETEVPVIEIEKVTSDEKKYSRELIKCMTGGLSG